MNCIVILLFGSVSSLPFEPLSSIAEHPHFEEFDNYVPKGDLPKYEYSTNELEDTTTPSPTNQTIQPTEAKTLVDIADYIIDDPTTLPPTTEYPEDQLNSGSAPNRTLLRLKDRNQKQIEIVNSTQNENQSENQEEEDDSSEEEGGNMVTSLLSAFLGGLSRPDGSIDLEAITGLLGSLSTQNPDGSYDFSGLSDLLMGFFGGGEGGSDVGAFIGGLAGAFLNGISPPGARGTGQFLGSLVGGILPALSAPAPSEDSGGAQAPPQYDSGGFIGGLLQGVFGSSGGASSGGNGTNLGSGGGSKFSLIKGLFSLVTSVLTSSSGSSSSSH